MATNQALRPTGSYSAPWDASDGYLILDDVTNGLLDADELAPTQYEQVNLPNIISVVIRRGRTNQRDQMSAGTCNVRIQSVASVPVSDFVLGQPIEIFAFRPATGGSSTVFYGDIQNVMEVTDPITGQAEIAIQATDSLRRLEDYRLVEPTYSVPEGVSERLAAFVAGLNDGIDTVNGRINAALKAVEGTEGFAKSIGTSDIELAGIEWTGTVRSVIDEAVLSDGGVFFAERDSTYRFYPESVVYLDTNYTTPVVAITDGTGSYPARAIDTMRGTDRVDTQVSIRNGNGTVVTRHQAAETTLYGLRNVNLQTGNTSDAYTATLADLYSYVYAAQDEQFAPLVVHAARGDWETKLGALELYDYVTVSGTDAVIEGITHSYSVANGWSAMIYTNRAVPAAADYVS